MGKDYSLSKADRLCSKKDIDILFRKGNRIKVSPFVIIYKHTHSTQVMFSVPKRKFKKAVDRNYIKRQLKEGYRKNKAIIADKSIHIAFVYTADKPLTTKEIEDKIILSLHRLDSNGKSDSMGAKNDD